MALKNKAERKTPAQLQSQRADLDFRKVTEVQPQAPEVAETPTPATTKTGKVDRSREPKKNIRIELPESVHKALRVYLVASDNSIQQYVSSLIEDSLKRKGAL